MKYVERYVRAFDVVGNVYDCDVKMNERFNIVDRTFRTRLKNLGKKIIRVEWHGFGKGYYFDYSKT